MKTAKLPETKLRKSVETRMRDHWMMTWHEDREITPGVPDLHYVMKGPPDEQYRVGWLELKAIDTRMTKTQRIGVEPSQHQYLRRWCPVMPIHFLVRIQDRIYVVPGAFHKELTGAASELDMKLLCLADFNESQMTDVLPSILKELTRI